MADNLVHQKPTERANKIPMHKAHTAAKTRCAAR
jgi:hypothetical protein